MLTILTTRRTAMKQCSSTLTAMLFSFSMNIDVYEKDTHILLVLPLFQVLSIVKLATNYSNSKKLVHSLGFMFLDDFHLQNKDLISNLHYLGDWRIEELN